MSKKKHGVKYNIKTAAQTICPDMRTKRGYRLNPFARGIQGCIRTRICCKGNVRKIQAIKKIDMEAKIGKTYHWLCRKYHIVSLFDDCGERYMVVKWWNKYRQWWNYSVAHVDLLEEPSIKK